VPVVNGFEQAEGADHAASVVSQSTDDRQDSLVLEMAAAYPAVAGLRSLERSVVFDRATAGGRIVLSDDFGFAQGGGEFQSTLVTPLSAEIGTGEVRIGDQSGGVRVRFDPAAVTVGTEHHGGVEKQYAPSVDLTRVLFSAVGRPQAGRIALEISPL
jgi:hypothetical protein